MCSPHQATLLRADNGCLQRISSVVNVVNNLPNASAIAVVWSPGRDLDRGGAEWLSAYSICDKWFLRL